MIRPLAQADRKTVMSTATVTSEITYRRVTVVGELFICVGGTTVTRIESAATLAPEASWHRRRPPVGDRTLPQPHRPSTLAGTPCDVGSICYGSASAL